MKTIRFISIFLLVSIIIFSSNIVIVKAKNVSDYTDSIRAYFEQIAKMHYKNTVYGLLSYDKNSAPALVVIREGLNSFSINYYNYINGEVKSSYSESSYFGGVRDNRTYSIVSDSSSGLDYIKVTSGGQYGIDIETIFYHYSEQLYKFTGSELVEVASVYYSQESNEAPEYTYNINNKDVTKSAYDSFMKTKHVKQELFTISTGTMYLEEPDNSYDAILNVIKSFPFELFVTDKKIETSPIILNGRTLVPVRALSESLGATVKWEAETQGIKVIKDSTVIQMSLNSKQALVNGKTVNLDVSPMLINGNTFVPIRFIAEKLGYFVKWDEEMRTITVADYFSVFPFFFTNREKYESLHKDFNLISKEIHIGTDDMSDTYIYTYNFGKMDCFEWKSQEDMFIVNYVTITNNDIVLPCGIKIGDSKTETLNKLSEANESFDRVSLSFYWNLWDILLNFDNDILTSITAYKTAG